MKVEKREYEREEPAENSRSNCSKLLVIVVEWEKERIAWVLIVELGIDSPHAVGPWA
jgi:hypothetical protein